MLKAGQGGESPCVAGKRQGEAETLGAGEVSISSSGAESGLLLRTDGRLELNGQVMVNGQSLNGLIRQIVLAILGGGRREWSFRSKTETMCPTDWEASAG